MSAPAAPRAASRLDRLVQAYIGAFTLGLLVVDPAGGWPATVVNLSYFLLGPVAVHAQWRAARTVRDPGERSAWGAMALASLLIWSSGFAWTYWEGLFGAPMPDWLSDVSGIIYTPLALVAFLRFPADPNFRWSDARVRADAALLLTGAVTLSWHFALAPARDGAGLVETVTAVLEWLVAIAGSFAVLRARDRAVRDTVAFALAGHLMFILTDYFWARALTEYVPGHWVDLLWFSAWAMRWYAPRHAVRRAPDATHAPAEYRGTIIPATFVVGAYALLLLVLLMEPTRVPWDVALAASLMTALLVVRQRLTLRDNSLLAERTARQTATFRSIIAGTADHILLVRDDHSIAYASPSAGRLLGPLGGRRLPDLFEPAERAGVLEWLAERSTSLGQRGYRCRLLGADGAWRDIELRAQDRRDDPAIGGYVINGRDISQEIALEHRLGHARKLAMLSEMAGRIAHAFNNTLAALQAHADVLARELPVRSPAREDARAIAAAAERGAGITRQLLGFSGRHMIRPEPVRPFELVDGIAATLARLLGPTRRLVLEDEGRDALVLVDRAQCEQVLVNLVTNARDAMPDGGEVRIAVERRGDADVRIAVQDSGAGIPPEAMPRIFEPFFTTKAPGRGTGLGLAMVASIARRAGGRVEVDSVPGRGTTVTLVLPAIAAPASPAPVEVAEPPTGPAPRARILFVDDDALVRRAGLRLLERLGYEPIEAADGAAALAVAEDATVPIDLLLTDLMMPGISGREVIARFRVLRPGVPIVCVTGFAAAREDDGALALEVSAIVAKPFTSATLRRSIAAALRDA